MRALDEAVQRRPTVAWLFARRTRPPAVPAGARGWAALYAGCFDFPMALAAWTSPASLDQCSLQSSNTRTAKSACMHIVGCNEVQK